MSPRRTCSMTDTSKLDEQEDAAMHEVPWMGDIHDEKDPPPGKIPVQVHFSDIVTP